MKHDRPAESMESRKAGTLASAFDLLKSLPSDFYTDGRTDPPPQERKGLLEIFIKNKRELR